MKRSQISCKTRLYGIASCAVCCDPSWNGFVQAFFGHKGPPLLGWSDEPNEEQTVKKRAGPSEPNEEHYWKRGLG